MTASIKCVTRIPYDDDISRDVSENVFYFMSAALTVDNDIMASDAVARLQSFWQNVPADSPHDLGWYLSGVLKRDTDAGEIRVYDNAAPSGTPPFTTARFTIGAAGVGTNFPEEVALCSSYWSDQSPLGGGALLPRPRRQGRIYVGPLNASATTNGTNGYARPSVGFQTALLNATKHIAEDNSGDGGWCVFSRAANAASVIDHGWVDDAWDTQRRRGVDASTRTSWTASI